MIRCARPGCHTLAKCSCSGCKREQYCGGICQKADWKIHKSMCPILKTLSNKLQPFHEATRIINEILASTKGEDFRILEHLLSYAEYQFGKEVPGIDYRKRVDGKCISNWVVDIEILYNINARMSNICSLNYSISTSVRNDLRFPCSERSLCILSPWLILFDSTTINPTDNPSNDPTNYILMELCCLELSFAMMTMHKNQFDVAEGHCQRCLTYSRRIGVEGEKKTTLVFSALRAYVDLRKGQGNISGVAGAVEAASTLVNCLVAKGNLYDAQRYAEQTYANLKDLKNGIDQESEVVASGSLSLASVILRQDDGDLIKAEELARESLRIRTKLYDPQHFRVDECCQCLGSILQKQRKMGDETKDFFERSLAICIRNEGPDGRNTAANTVRIGQFYYQLAILQSTVISKRSHLRLAKSYFKEAIRIGTKVMNPTNPHLVGAKSCLSDVMSELSRV